jgi:hypothetical protein
MQIPNVNSKRSKVEFREDGLAESIPQSWSRRAVRRSLRGGLLAFAVLAPTLLASGRSQAATITVDVKGAPQVGHCNLTDAVQAATTNVMVHNCTAGSSTTTDTIILNAAGTYQNYGKTLHIPPTGGAVIIRSPSGQAQRTILAPNYGYPSPPGGTTDCLYPAAIFAGGTLTLNNVGLQSAGTDFVNGICQYAGSLTLDNGTVVGSPSWVYNDAACPGGTGFHARGIYSTPNGSNNHRTISIINNSAVVANCSPNNGGGIALLGNVDLTTNFATIEGNVTAESGGGIYMAGGWGKMGNVTLTNTDMFYNQAGTEGGWGGAVYLGGDDVNASFTYSGHSFQQNIVWTQTGGAIYVGSGMGTNKVTISNMALLVSNISALDGQQSELNSDWWVYNAVQCKTSSSIYSVTGSEWWGHNPPLKGDGTCTFP